MLYILENMENHGVMQRYQWCDARKTNVTFLQGKDILMGEKNLSHGDYSHYMV